MPSDVLIKYYSRIGSTPPRSFYAGANIYIFQMLGRYYAPLPASTNPVQVVQAVRLEQQATDPAMTPAASLDDSIIASLNYPEVLRLMDENLDWTVKLGEACITQQDGVMDAIRRFRRQVSVQAFVQTTVPDHGSHPGRSSRWFSTSMEKYSE